jgi:hypothetical protein
MFEFFVKDPALEAFSCSELLEQLLPSDQVFTPKLVNEDKLSLIAALIVEPWIL